MVNQGILLVFTTLFRHGHFIFDKCYHIKKLKLNKLNCIFLYGYMIHNIIFCNYFVIYSLLNPLLIINKYITQFINFLVFKH